jgi:hypothetical protein
MHLLLRGQRADFTAQQEEQAVAQTDQGALANVNDLMASLYLCQNFFRF